VQEIFFLLLPVAAFYGWYMGVRSVYQKKQKSGNKLSRDYVQGLNFLLNEQPDKAVDHFIALLDVDDETIETHLALGNLFRQNGEVDRAIRIHQNLIARPSLTLEQRDLAMLQLGKDFYQSGLFDRSEEIFIQLKESPEYKLVALENLLLIYQQLKDWQEAVNCTEQMNKMGNSQAKPRTLSYLYCSLADQLKKPEQQKQALKLYQKALVTFPKCIRACIAIADHHIENAQFQKAIEVLEQVPELDIDFTEVILEKLHGLHKQLNTERALMDYLHRIVNLGAGASAVILLATLITQFKSVEQAQQFMLQELRRNPTMKGFNHLMTYHLRLAQSENEKESLLFLQTLVSEQITFRPHYRCQKCGYSTKKLFWQCPSCKNWGRIKPIRGLDGE
jgi:lipopolysaccharide biosynthesis regulator YciM